LKAAPMPMVGAFLRPLSRKRRYMCSNCGWVGYRRRLQRRHSELPSLAPKSGPSAAALVFFVLVAAVLILSGVFLLRSCQIEPGPTLSGG
jgi:hypothetical protein